MLTFFEYLRQRAFESIVVGVQDALDSLEKEPYKSQLNATANQPGRDGIAEFTGASHQERRGRRKTAHPCQHRAGLAASASTPRSSAKIGPALLTLRPASAFATKSGEV